MSKKRTTPARRIQAVSPEQQKRNRYIRIGLLALAGVVVLLLAAGIYWTAVVVPSSPVAVVHGQKITTKDYQARVLYQSLVLAGQAGSMRSQLQMLDPDDESTPLIQQIYQQQLESLQSAASTLPSQVLETMIEEELVRQESARRGITVSDDELEEQVGKSFGYDPNPDPTPTMAPTPTVPVETPTSEATASSTGTPGVTPTAAATADATVTTEPTATGEATAASTGTPGVTPTAAATADATITTEPTATGEATAEPEASPTVVTNPEPTPTPLPTPTPMSLESYQTLRSDYLDYVLEQTGFTEAAFLEMMRTYALQEKLQEALAEEVPVSAPQVNVRQILVYSQDEIDAINERIDSGEEFGALAQELSQDTATKENGGELGWMPLSSTALPQTVVERAFAVEPGQREVVSSYLGLHLIEVLEKADDRPLDEATISAAKSAALSEWLATAMQDPGVERRWSRDKVPDGLPTSY